MITVSQPKFRLGSVVATPDAIAALERVGQSPWSLLTQHVSGQWGDLSDDDKRLNDEALIHGDRILSSYVLQDGVTTVWVITEADRSSTCLLLPENY